MSNEKIIYAGIDLGTCFSSSSIYENDIVQLVKTKGMAKDNKPSVVRYDKDGSTLVGYEAKIQAYKYTKQTIFNSKRLIGISYDDKIVEKVAESSTVEIINKDNFPVYKLINKSDGEEIGLKKPSDVSVDILKSIREDIVHSGALDNETPEVYCVITVPAYFTQEQRAETKLAAEKANLHVLALLNEPSAAIVYYAYKKRVDRGNNPQSPINTPSKTYLVCDIGGGTTDLTVAKFSNDEPVKIIGYGGDTFLGGEDITAAIMNYVIEQTKEQFNVDLGALSEKKPKLRHQLYNKCEEAKIRLSGGKRMSVEVDISDLGGFEEKEDEDEDDEDEYFIELTGDKFVEICKDIFDRIITCLDNFFEKLKDKIKKEDIDCVIMVGGSSNIPSIIDLVKNYFNGEVPLDHSSDTEVVARGASIYASSLGLKKITEKEENKDGEKEKGKEGEKGENDSSEDNTTSDKQNLNRDIIEDVVSMNLGVESGGLSFSCIIPSGTRIPTEKPFKCDFYTSVDYQTQLSFNIFEGDSFCVLFNKMIGSLIVPNITLELAGKICVSVMFEIDESNILHATAYEKSKNESEENGEHKKYSTSINYRNKEQSDNTMSAIWSKKNSSELVKEIKTKFIDKETGKFNEKLFKDVFTSRRNLRYLYQELREKLKEKISSKVNEMDLKSPIGSNDSSELTKCNNALDDSVYSFDELYRIICVEHYSLSHNISKMFSPPEYFNKNFRDFALIYLLLQTMNQSTEIIINNNSFNGILPPTIGHFETLTVLNLSYDELSGEIPYSIGKLKNLEILDLSFNSFEGDIPESIYELIKLKKLCLNNNKLTGSISSKIDQLINLEILMLNNNKLESEIPISLEKIHLKKLNLSNNSVKGHLSQGYIESFEKDAIILDDCNIPK
ncbi:actin-like ATPase domain-containing protein [Neocallimastix lanati (nom. inval.)]|jgi:molecular chaperone DnaK (HSP70)|uniref:Actin-like ATPase domain-containing protein n=1 Tax=Neocallimastix californiae TaxID=1754190 RepID=A0A1Y2ETP5_9FUNG|nr:actin-like ATPase domain-containing protein [Neocallimastix sp. JGI-2020a]ORY74907.1 actin-like ATPase domain-containing protein [Neocallimastix californiae]|eukprot:ORY74907.1 actin-like ATPase domain-containing protein [Neocallimastix californiae]